MFLAIGLAVSVCGFIYYTIRFLSSVAGLMAPNKDRITDTILYRDGQQIGYSRTVRRATGSVTLTEKNGVRTIRVVKKLDK